MLFALLYNGQDELIAAAPAVFQYAVGDVYWRDSYASHLDWDVDCQTAYVEISHDDLIDKLNSLETEDTHLLECRKRVDEITGPVPDAKKTRAA